MLSLKEFVEWVGFTSFEERPFDVLDSIVLAQFGYLDISKVWKQSPMTIRDLIDEQSSFVMQMVPDGQDHDLFMESLAKTSRYGSLLVEKNVDTFDEKEHIQFGAMTIRIDKNHRLIVFKGTDDSLAGWREDFMMSFTRTFSQTAALMYLKDEIQEDIHYFVAGHSKGGHLAIFSTSQLSDERLNQIDAIYDLDGPGLNKDVMDVKLTGRIDEKTVRVIPQYCIVGNIFNPHFTNKHIVKSSAQGTMQHGLASWLMNHNGLIEAEREDPQSVWMSKSINDWMENVSQKDRETFVSQLFDALAVNGNQNFEQVKRGNLSDFQNILNSFVRSDFITKKIATDLPAVVIANSGPIVKEKISQIKDKLKK